MQANMPYTRFVNRDLDTLRREHNNIKNEVREIKNHLYDVCRQSLTVDNALCNKIKQQSPTIAYTTNDRGVARTAANTNVIVKSSTTKARGPRTMDPSLPDGGDFTCSADDGNTKIVRSYNVESFTKQ
ncbi:ORF138 [Leucania separata nucleopolyhedrovirus]|uniref:ORF138 n=1 Tax=Leucania separata nucleopolyhedrovirus TaxID=1307956 RepID=Q0IKY1_NPVLS|nr:ORF138 [Leucania separata nucleopolyhedrovirus]AAR28902.1 ORF138 [Leucania separata nucleopolyhedrovirus]